ncbi:S53 family peptidase [Phaeacidiphilus oryzae]|uniref:S53 family peptidase n=1 Tax=Phaeacidiphilus oryzae TaxID=348818 RepID=UPI0006915340|nr:S53 family peptidase [Phaeacidiphilus oryzae]
MPSSKPESTPPTSSGARHRNRARRRTALAVATAGALAVTGYGVLAQADAATTTAATASGTAATASGTAVARACAASGTPGVMSCNAERVTSVRGRSTALRGVQRSAAPSGLAPADLRGAYKLPAGGGAGQTVAIVDAYNDPKAESDMATYRSQYGLAACSKASGCFKQVSQTGSTTALPKNDTGWAGEISLDLDMVSAIAPKAHVVLVEAKSANMSDLGAAVDQAVKMGAKYVSNSYGGGESSSDASYDSAYFDHPGVAITASAGDSGYGAQYPAGSKYVTAVGGTSLKKASNARGWTESAWSGTGSGCSADDAKPSWQKDTGCAKRSIADVSAVADPATGVAVYQTYGASGWSVYGGTSASSPIIAGVYALAGSPGSAVPAADPYAHPSALFDVASGSNGSCSTAYLCSAGAGYDGPTGLGTPDGTAAFAG